MDSSRKWYVAPAGESSKTITGKNPILKRKRWFSQENRVPASTRPANAASSQKVRFLKKNSRKGASRAALGLSVGSARKSRRNRLLKDCNLVENGS